MESENYFYNPFVMAGYIFDRLNSRFCSDCPTAVAETSAAARKIHTMFSKESGCCSLCATFSGYIFADRLDIIGAYHVKLPILENMLTERLYELKEKYGFDENYGFFNTSKHECRLPRKERSIKCSVYYCNTIGNSLRMEEIDTLMQLRERMIELRKEEMGI